MRRRSATIAGLAGALLLGAALLHDPPPSPEPFDEDWTMDAARIAWVIPDLELQYFDGATLWATRQTEVWTSDDEGFTWTLRGVALPADPGAYRALRNAIGRTKLARRLWPRRGIEALLVLDSGEVLISAPPSVQRSTDGGRSFEWVHRHRQDRGVLRHWDHRGDVVLFAEYGAGGTDHALWRSDDRGASWTQAWTLPARGEPGGGRHLHGVQFAPDGRAWLMVGDRDEDARIGPLVAGRLEPVVAGDQRAKATALVFSGDAVLWGSDAPPGPWGVYRWDPTGGLQRVHELDGPVLWSTKLADGRVLVATEIEGVGVDAAELWVAPEGGPWRRLLRAPSFEGEDPVRGTISFPLGAPSPVLFGTVDRLGRLRRAAIRVDTNPPPKTP